MEALEKINKICMKIAKITDHEINEAMQEAKEQSEYVHPLKNKTSSEINKTGDRNIQILDSLNELRKKLQQK